MNPAEIRLYEKIIHDMGDEVAQGFIIDESAPSLGLQVDEHTGERFFSRYYKRPARTIPGCVDSIEYSFVFISGKTFSVRPYARILCPALGALGNRFPADAAVVGAHQCALDSFREKIEYLYSVPSSLPVLSGRTYTTGRRTELSRPAAYSDAVGDLQIRFPTSIAVDLFDKVAGPDEIEEVCYKSLKDVSAWRGDNPIPNICYVFALYCDLHDDSAAGSRVLSAASNSGLRADIDFPKLRAMLTGV